MAKHHHTKKAKRGATLPPRLNEPFSDKMLVIGSGKEKLQRGHIRHAPDNIPCFGRVGFLFNPSSINVNHSIDPGLVDDSASGGQNQALGVTLGNTVGIGDVTLSLLFDRTYEVWNRRPGSQASKFGVYHDVACFYDMIGLTGAKTTSNLLTQTLLGGGITEAAVYPVSPARPTRVYANIGSSLKYYGQITGLNVTYTHWSWDMVPMRCAVDVGIMLLSDPNATKRTVSVGALTNGLNTVGLNN